METQSLAATSIAGGFLFSLREKLARSHNKKTASNVRNHFVFLFNS